MSRAWWVHGGDTATIMDSGETMYCYRCGNKLPEESLFCNRCGTRVPTTPERVRGTRPSRLTATDSADPEVARRTAGPTGDTLPVEDDQFELDEDLADEEEWDEEEPVDEELLDEEEEPAEEALPSYRSQGEKVIFSINPAFYPVTTGYIVSTFSALLLVALISFFKLGFWLALVGAIVLFIPSIIRHIRHLHTIFTLTTIKLEISEGLFSKTTRNIPLRHIQDVSVSENFSERILGIGDIVVDTPAMETNLTLNNVNEPRRYADLILEQLERWT